MHSYILRSSFTSQQTYVGQIFEEIDPPTRTVENWTESVTWIFVCSLPPTNWTLNSWWKLKKGKWKGMRESCLVYCYSGIQSLFEVVLLYTFYTFGAETRESKTGILPLWRTSWMKLLWMRAGSTWVTCRSWGRRNWRIWGNFATVIEGLSRKLSKMLKG